MNRKTLWHIIIWSVIIGTETVAYMSNWGPRFWVMSVVNVSLALLLFYFSRYLALNLVNKISRIEMYKCREFRLLIAIVLIFTVVRVFSDYYLFGSGNETPEWPYAFGLFRLALSYAIPAIAIAIGEKRKLMIRVLGKEQREIEEYTNTLQLRVIHLNSSVEGKEQVIRQMDDKVDELQFNIEMLNRDIVQLEATVAKEHEHIAANNRVIAENNIRIEQLAEQAEMLQLNMFTLEKEISERQNLILVLKAELLKGNEEYKQLVYTYKRKFDFYNRELEKYRNLYGEIDDE